MVMKRNAMRKNLRQSILKSFGRYIAIAAIIALGTALFAGLLMTKADMIVTGQEFMDQYNMFDIRLISTYGWAEEQVEKAAELDGVSDAEGIFYIDLIARLDSASEDEVYRLYAMPKRMNQLSLRGGRMPQNDRECLIDGIHRDDSILGTQVVVSENNDEDDLEVLLEKTYTVVGYVSSTAYMDKNLGTTSVGNGILAGYLYLAEACFDADYYPEIHLTIPGEHIVYSDAYNNAMDAISDTIEPQVELLAWERFHAVKAEAEEKYQDGYQEYLDGIEEYEDGKAEGERELADAYQELIDGEQEIEDNRKKLQNAERSLYDAKLLLEENAASVRSNKKLIQDQLSPLNAQKEEMNNRASALKANSGYTYGEILSILQSAESTIAGLEADIAEIQGKIDALKEAPLNDENTAALAAAQASKAAKESELTAAYQRIEIANANAGEAEELATYFGTVSALESNLSKVLAGEKEIEENLAKVKSGITEVYNGYEELKEAEQEIADGWEEYYDGKEEFEQEIADAEQELEDARIELADAREEIDSMDDPEMIILDRRSNAGYNNLKSSSDILQGVSKVLPVFFLLIASLVCITTMTRMIEEERTQIGTLKALGYGNAAIISKYMIYAGSGAVLGCGIGAYAGSAFFPKILWIAYSTMLFITPEIQLTFNLPLCIAIVAVYTAIMLLVTWYCCHRTLEEVPAELIRPKAPDAGKALLVERLPFWNKISFLNKVTIRNIFRYRQRMAMMLVGIGGCTALLLTGFGLRDSIVNVVNIQFEEVTVYDLEVYFHEAQTLEQQNRFTQKIGNEADNILFYHQSSVDMEFDSQSKEIYLISAEEELTSFIDLHANEAKLPFPEMNEIALSVGVAEMMNIQVGDPVSVRNSDMQVMDLTVSAIYDNHVNNYAIVAPQTIEAQWGAAPEQQMAFVKMVDQGQAHAVSARISSMDDVMNVSISEDMADMVSNMMEALDMVIVLVVFCAGLLAVIVLYNLTNININERIREIATIKVLGFNASETAAYVFKENLVLTVVGSIFGLFLGKVFLVFVMSQIRIDMVWFKTTIETISYVISFALTIVAAVAVNFIFYFKLQKINMAEALKSVE